MTVNLLPRVDDAVQRSAQREELSRTDIVNRAVTFYDSMMEQVLIEGAELLIRPKDSSDLVKVHLV
jgi:hypothetical protein